MPHQAHLRRKGKEGLKASHHYTLSGPGKLLFFLSEAFIAASVGARLGGQDGAKGVASAGMEAAGGIGCICKGCTGLLCVCVFVCAELPLVAVGARPGTETSSQPCFQLQPPVGASWRGAGSSLPYATDTRL